MKLSAIIREKAGLSKLNRDKIRIVSGSTPPIRKGDTFHREGSKYIPATSYIEVGEDWLLSLEIGIQVTNEDTE